jgi:hypothetical protein
LTGDSGRSRLERELAEQIARSRATLAAGRETLAAGKKTAKDAESLLDSSLALLSRVQRAGAGRTEQG